MISTKCRRTIPSPFTIGAATHRTSEEQDVTMPLRVHASRGKVELALMTDRIIRRVRRREVARVSSHNCREQAPSVAMPHFV
jgi:hypothetical protein